MASSTSLSAVAGDGTVLTLDLGNDENQISPAWLDAVEAALDQVEQTDGPTGLVTIAHNKFWSNGFDLAWLTANPDEFAPFTVRFQALLARLLTLKVPTVAAIQGHAFGAAAMLALAHDYRVMRADRGYFCFPEINLGLAFPPGWVALIGAKLPTATAHTAMTTGYRYGGNDAVSADIIDSAVTEDRVMTAATDKARALSATAEPTLAAIKKGLYSAATTTLTQAVA
jgi:enoyl-CoA hydratase/carnithine racemase